MNLPVWFEVGTFVALGVLLLADLLIVTRRPHEPSLKESGLWVAFYVAMALLFGFGALGVSQGAAALLAPPTGTAFPPPIISMPCISSWRRRKSATC